MTTIEQAHHDSVIVRERLLHESSPQAQRLVRNLGELIPVLEQGMVVKAQLHSDVTDAEFVEAMGRLLLLSNDEQVQKHAGQHGIGRHVLHAVHGAMVEYVPELEDALVHGSIKVVDGGLDVLEKGLNQFDGVLRNHPS